MGNLGKYIKYSCLGIALLLSSCIDDDLSDCPPNGTGGSYIRFVYDYNMSFEDLFSKQVSKINVYLFDKNGTFLYLMTDECTPGTTFPKGYTMKIPEEVEVKGVSRFVTWCGLYSEARTVPTMTPEVSQTSDLKVQLKQSTNNEFDDKMEPLWYGSELITQNNNWNDTTTISLIKDSNIIRIVLQSVEDSLELNVNDFRFTMDSKNGSYDCNNNVSSDTNWHYFPYLTYNEDKTCSIAEMNTLRLLADRDNRLLVEHIPTESPLIDIDLNKIINALKAQDYSGMPLQEYMDREDEYKITVFVKSTNGEADGPWAVVDVQINPWIDRDQDHSGK